MQNVVESGTARRVYHTFIRSDRKPYVIGGKTGTGDHRHETFGPGGQVISSRVVNRTATFAFYVGDRFFGVISAHVPGAEAAKFDFTSALAAELLKILSPALVPMIERSGAELSPFTKDAMIQKVAANAAQLPQPIIPDSASPGVTTSVAAPVNSPSAESTPPAAVKLPKKRPAAPTKLPLVLPPPA